MDSGAIDWTVVSVGIALGGLILAAIRDSRVTARELRAEMRTEIKGLEERLNKRIDEVQETLSAGQDKLAERVSRLEEGQGQLSERLGRVEEGQGQLSERLDEKIDGLAAHQDEKMDGLAARLGRVEEGQEQLSERLGRQEQEQARMNGVLETLPERLGRQEQEQARMNGVLETIRAGLSYRVERADVGERVAEDGESYETEG